MVIVIIFLKIETASWTLIRHEKLGKDNRHDCEHN